MRNALTEILGVFGLFVGAGLVVAAASFVSVALAVLVCGVFVIVGSVVAIYVAAVLDSKPKAPERP